MSVLKATVFVLHREVKSLSGTKFGIRPRKKIFVSCNGPKINRVR